MEETVFDITKEYTDCYGLDYVVKVEAKNTNVLVLEKFQTPVTAPDKSICHYGLDYKWLSKPILTEQDVKNQNFACVLGNDYIYVTEKEVKDYKNKSLFDLFNLF